MNYRNSTLLIILPALLLVSCSAAKNAGKSSEATGILLADSSLAGAHTGIMIADAVTGKVLYDHQPHHFFVPASNTKLFTLYAGLSCLGDSLIGGYIAPQPDGALLFRSNGDPTFLHPDFPRQRLAGMLTTYRDIKWENAELRTNAYGSGWSWDDYMEVYMAPRSSMPMFGNEVTFRNGTGGFSIKPSAAAVFASSGIPADTMPFEVSRKFEDADFTFHPGRSRRVNTNLLLNESSGLRLAAAYFKNHWSRAPFQAGVKFTPVFSQPADSMFRPLMHRSDNFFAEQTLLMISNGWWGFMDEKAVTDSLLRTSLAALPDKPRWADGSGLSRYNLFSPADFVWLLRKMEQQFGINRISHLLPGAGQGTLTGYYNHLKGSIFAKTGTLAGVVALSGYLYAKSGRLLVFSVLVNNHRSNAPAVRRAVEKYLTGVWDRH